MGVVSQFVPLAEYLGMEYPEGVKDELIKGEVVIAPAPKPNHALVSTQLLLLLTPAVDKTKFVVGYDMSIIVKPTDPATVPRPDVYVMERARFRAAAREDRYPEGSPELAIEVISPGNTKKAVAEKVDLYLAGGSWAVWLVYPKRRAVEVWDAGGKSGEFQGADAVPLPSAMSDRAIPVSEIFSVLD